MNYHFRITIVNWDAEPTVKYQAKFRQEEPMLPCYILGYSFETESFEPVNNLPVSSVNYMYLCKLNWNNGKKKLSLQL